MKQYTPHIRIPFSLFDSTEYKQIPDTLKPYCLAVLVCLLKFVNTKSGRCYPRRHTIASMTGLSNSTIYKATEELKRVKIIHTKRLPSTLLYTIEPKFIFGDMRNKKVIGVINTSDMRNTTLYNRTNTKELSLLTNIIKKISNKGGDQEKIIIELATTLTPAELTEAIKANDNPYYSKRALEYQERMNKRLIDIPKNILDNVRKRTNYFYKSKVHQNKEKDARETATKDFLSKSKKKG